MTNIDKDKELLIRDLGIFELRGLARQLGVPSPTTKKREELIDSIITAMQSSDTKETQGKRKGRPFKKLSSIKDILTVVTEEGAPYDDLSYQSMLGFAQVSAEFDLNDDYSGEKQQFTGFARVHDKNVSFIDVDKNVWVFLRSDTKFIENIKNGDKILVNGYSTNIKDQYVGVEVCEINGLPSQSYQAKNISHGLEVISNSMIPFGNKNAKEGRRNSVCLAEDLYESDNLKNTYKYCMANGIDFVLLGLNISFEDAIYFNEFSKKIDFTTKYGSNIALNLNKILDAINYTNQRLQSGSNVFLAITDIMEVVRVLEKALKSQPENIQEMKRIVVTELLSIAKSYKDGPSCTMLVCYRQNDYDNEYLQSEILRICKNV